MDAIFPGLSCQARVINTRLTWVSFYENAICKVQCIQFQELTALMQVWQLERFQPGCVCCAGCSTASSFVFLLFSVTKTIALIATNPTSIVTTAIIATLFSPCLSKFVLCSETCQFLILSSFSDSLTTLEAGGEGGLEIAGLPFKIRSISMLSFATCCRFPFSRRE